MPPIRRTVTPGPALASLIGQLMLGDGGFREGSFVSDEGAARRSGGVGGTRHLWGDPAARALRYAVQWSLYEGNVYRNIHRYAETMKEQFSLYNHIRPIYNPTHRLVQFYAQHLMGGMLDRDAGDGKTAPSALPILTDNDAIRPGIASMWRHSNWQAKKDILTTYGAAMGDTVLMVVDDPANRRVTLKPIHPLHLTHFDRDDYGHCRGYRLDDFRPDPEFDIALGPAPLVQYSETCEKVGGSVVFTTYRDFQPYDWRDYDDDLPDSRRVGPSWSEPYGFVPLVLIQHIDKGLGWGWSELHPTFAKLIELDELASHLHDAVGIAVEPQYLFTGVDPASDPSFADEDDDELSPSSGRDDGSGRRKLKTLTAASPDARATPLVAPIDISAALATVQSLVAEIERDHPELDRALAGLNASGKARKVAQEHVEAMVIQRRAAYDAGEVYAQMMGLSIGGMKGYPDYEGIDEGSYDRGELQHSIGDRPVFSIDDDDRIATSAARSVVLKTLTDAGVPLGVAMEEAGYPKEKVDAAVAGAAKMAVDATAQQRALLMGGEDPNAPPM